MIQDTSIKAYREDVAPTLGERQSVVYETIVYLDDATNSEIADCLKWPINTVTPRVFELRKLGMVEDVGKRPCKITGRLAYVWSKRVGQRPLWTKSD